MSALEVRDLVTRVRTPAGERRPIVNGVSFDVQNGEIVGIVGESGSGKSMTARSIMRLLPAGAEVEGSVTLDGADVLGAGRRELERIRAERMAMIFQDPRAHIDPLWTCRDHLTEGLRHHGGLTRVAAEEIAVELLEQCGIDEPQRVLRSHPHQLSGGMLQRVLIAAALAGEPRLIIADEPTTALDVTIQAEIVAIFSELRQQRGLSMLFITHDLDLAGALCDRILVFYAGRIVEAQTTDRLFDAPQHPYTSGLLRARPRIDAPRGRLAVIPGRPPNPEDHIEGCPFGPRCPHRVDKCLRAPPLRRLGDGARAACWRSEELSLSGTEERAGLR